MKDLISMGKSVQQYARNMEDRIIHWKNEQDYTRI